MAAPASLGARAKLAALAAGEELVDWASLAWAMAMAAEGATAAMACLAAAAGAEVAEDYQHRADGQERQAPADMAASLKHAL